MLTKGESYQCIHAASDGSCNCTYLYIRSPGSERGEWQPMIWRDYSNSTQEDGERCGLQGVQRLSQRKGPFHRSALSRCLSLCILISRSQQPAILLRVDIAGCRAKAIVSDDIASVYLQTAPNGSVFISVYVWLCRSASSLSVIGYRFYVKLLPVKR